MIESVSRVLGSDRVEGSVARMPVMSWITWRQSYQMGCRSLDVLGDLWCVMGADTALQSGYGVPDMSDIRPGETLSWNSFSTSWVRYRLEVG